MAAPAAAAAAEGGPDWSCLPAGVLRHIIRQTSAWQVPGSCVAAPVCRSWRAAAAGCSGICLLYQPGSYQRTSSLATWLSRNSHQLESLILMALKHGDAVAVLGPLAQAAEAAAEAGRPLPLHTLRVLGCDGPSLQLTGKLLAHLPNLHTLVTLVREMTDGFLFFVPVSSPTHDAAYIEERLAPLQQATQLQELSLVGPNCDNGACGHTVARLLPTNLRRLAWRTGAYQAIPDLSHLTHLSSLQLLGWDERSLASSKLPPGLQQLQLDHVAAPEQVLEGQEQLLVGFESRYFAHDHPQRLPRFTHLDLATVTAAALEDPAIRAALGQLPRLCTLRVRQEVLYSDNPNELAAVVSAAASLPSLQYLFLDLPAMPPAAGLAALTGLTRLTIVLEDSNSFSEQQQCEWAEELGRMPALKWLSVPGQLLLVERPWLGGLQQLRVLMLSNLLDTWAGQTDQNGMERVVQWLEACSAQDLPPRLLLLGFTGIHMHHVASHRLYQRVGRLLGSRGCEVVGGPNLELLGDPGQQMAGLPLELQQALLP